MVVIVVVMSSINSQVVIVVIMRLSLGSLCYSIWKDFLGKSSPEHLEKFKKLRCDHALGPHSVLDIPEA